MSQNKSTVFLVYDFRAKSSPRLTKIDVLKIFSNYGMTNSFNGSGRVTSKTQSLAKFYTNKMY